MRDFIERSSNIVPGNARYPLPGLERRKKLPDPVLRNTNSQPATTNSQSHQVAGHFAAQRAQRSRRWPEFPTPPRRRAGMSIGNRRAQTVWQPGRPGLAGGATTGSSRQRPKDASGVRAPGTRSTGGSEFEPDHRATARCWRRASLSRQYHSPFASSSSSRWWMPWLIGGHQRRLIQLVFLIDRKPTNDGVRMPSVINYCQ